MRVEQERDAVPVLPPCAKAAPVRLPDDRLRRVDLSRDLLIGLSTEHGGDCHALPQRWSVAFHPQREQNSCQKRGHDPAKVYEHHTSLAFDRYSMRFVQVYRNSKKAQKSRPKTGHSCTTCCAFVILVWFLAKFASNSVLIHFYFFARTASMLVDH